MRRIRLRPRIVFSNYIYFFPSLAMGAALLGDKYSRLLAQISLLLFIIADIRSTLRMKDKRKSHIIILISLLAITVYVALLQGYYQLLNSDFYAFLLLLFILDYFRDKNNWKNFRIIALNMRKYILLLSTYTVLLVLSVVFHNGFRVYGTGTPVLHGPFTYPHALAYSLIGMFCYTGMNGCGERVRFNLLIKIVIVLLIILTGVRTAALSIVVIIAADYLSKNKFSVKFGIALATALILYILAEYTNVLTNNPIIQRTIIASSQKTGISNGRELFNAYLINHFTGLSLKDKLFGIGLNRIRNVMALRWNVSIHAHNDFLNILLGYGVFGLVTFTVLLIMFCKQSKRWVFVIASIGVLIFANGLFMYHTFTPYLIIIPQYINEIYSRENKHDKK